MANCSWHNEALDFIKSRIFCHINAFTVIIVWRFALHPVHPLFRFVQKRAWILVLSLYPCLTALLSFVIRRLATIRSRHKQSVTEQEAVKGRCWKVGPSLYNTLFEPLYDPIWRRKKPKYTRPPKVNLKLLLKWRLLKALSSSLKSCIDSWSLLETFGGFWRLLEAFEDSWRLLNAF